MKRKNEKQLKQPIINNSLLSLNYQLEKRLIELKKQHKQLDELKKFVLGELSISTCLIERLSEIYEKKYQEKYHENPELFHFSKDRVPPLNEEQLMIGSQHIIDPTTDLSYFPRLLDLNEENYFKTPQEQKEAEERLQRVLEFENSQSYDESSGDDGIKENDNKEHQEIE